MRWKRYEVVRMVPDERRPGLTHDHRTAAFPARWMAEWRAWRSTAKLERLDIESKFAVREIPPKKTPKYWGALQVNQAARWYPVPSASVTAGSEVVHISIGISRWHALGRACRWAKPRSREFVRVSRCVGERTYVPVVEDVSD